MTRINSTPSTPGSGPAEASNGSEPTTHIVPGGHGHAFEVKRGTAFRIVDLHGQQIVDLMAWVLPYPSSLEHLSMSYTRYVLNGEAPPAVGDCLVTNKREPIFKITADVCHTHDMTFMACDPAFMLNTPDMSLKDLGCSRPGDVIEFDVLKDAVVAMSSCPFDVDGFGGGKATDIAVVTGLKPQRA